MKVFVTSDDIKAGIPQDPCFCAIAVALDRQMPPAGWVVSTKDGRRWEAKRGAGESILLPAVCAVFANRFDHGEGVRPFEFAMPSGAVQPGGVR